MRVLLANPEILNLSDKEAKLTLFISDYAFSSNAALSKVFASEFKQNGQIYKTAYGICPIKVEKDKSVSLTIKNKTGYSFNLHWHGMNITPDADGASSEVIFGTSTEIGPNLKIKIPIINNNSTFLFFHAHPMFIASSFVYQGVVGAVLVEDWASQKLKFKYPDDELCLIYQDFEFKEDGSADPNNLYTDTWRSCFGAINGQSCVAWTSENKYVDDLFYVTSSNLVKINLCNGTNSFRILYLGVQSEEGEILDFYHIGTDGGLRDPTLTKNLAIPPANRVSILVDLSCYKKVKLFFWNWDLSEVLDMDVDPNNNLIASVPILDPSNNSTPAPTPIPSEDSNINYPITPEIQRITQKIPNGNRKEPRNLINIKPFLEISSTMTEKRSLKKTIKQIRSIVYKDGVYLNPCYFYNLPETEMVATRSFVFYPAPTYNARGPIPVTPILTGKNQNIRINKKAPADSYQANWVSEGANEVAIGANQVLVDNWTNQQIDQKKAISKFFSSYPKKHYFSYKPKNLPTCLFKIFPYTKENASYTNTFMMMNDTLKVDIFKANTKILGINSSDEKPLRTVVINFPKTEDPLTIDRFKRMVNYYFKKTKIFNGQRLSDLLKWDWSYYPFDLTPNFLQSGYPKKYLNSVRVRLVNKSSYKIRVTASWSLLSFFGKPVIAMESSMNMGMNMNMNMGMNMNMNNNKCGCGSACQCQDCKCDANNKCNPTCQCNKNKCGCGSACQCQDCKCDANNKCNPTCQCGNDKELDKIFHLEPMPMDKNMDLLQNYPYYPDPLVPYDINQEDQKLNRCYKDILSYLIVEPRDKQNQDRENNGVYKGFMDGFMNDNFLNFSTKLWSSEKWYYFNLDSQDTHPFHFHLTSGFLNLKPNKKSPDWWERHPYSKNIQKEDFTWSKDTYAIGSQQWISFFVKFPYYSSEKGSMYHNKYRNIGYMYHCHYMTHHDMNMMGQYFVSD